MSDIDARFLGSRLVIRETNRFNPASRSEMSSSGQSANRSMLLALFIPSHKEDNSVAASSFSTWRTNSLGRGPKIERNLIRISVSGLSFKSSLVDSKNCIPVIVYKH